MKFDKPGGSAMGEIKDERERHRPLAFPDRPVYPPAKLACVDCVHYKKRTYACLHRDVAWFHPVFGDQDTHASTGRRAGAACGPEGKLWEAKQEPLFTKGLVALSLVSAGALLLGLWLLLVK